MLAVLKKNYRNEWVFFTITDATGAVVKVGIVPFIDLMQADGFEHADDNDAYLNVLDSDEDRMKLLNRAQAVVINRGWRKMEYRLHEVFQAWNRKTHARSKAVKCNETGQRWDSVNQCVKDTGVAYTQLHNHLKGQVGHRTVKGLTYKYV